MLTGLVLVIVTLAPPAGVRAFDVANDEGGAIRVTWEPAEGDTARTASYVVLRSEAADTGFEIVGEQPAVQLEFTDSDARNGVDYWYRVDAAGPADTARAEAIGPVRAGAQWFHTARLNILLMTLVISAVFLVYIARARRGVKMHVRRIAGLDAIDDALGRATEMGKPILFSFGLGYLTDMVVIAALPLLRRIGIKSAEFGTRLLVPNADPLVMTAAQETVKEAYAEAGRPDLYNADNVSFL
ncbi:fibronectin type III domain-containing protein, partial [candidate division WOR-3 bacterium]|nr:fibronectin type III domain-containing protein [candidate division WOR-3 bacterium]